MKRISTSTKFLVLAIVILLSVVGIVWSIFGAPHNIDKLTSEQSDTENIEYSGSTYEPAAYRINVLIMGIDEEGKAVSSKSFMNTGMADFLILLSFDLRTKECVAININRDTITDVATYGVGGIYRGKAKMQIALSHQYGDGLGESCLNTVKAVSDLFNGITIDYYISLHLDSIGIINDMVNGVEVLIEDDFSQVDPTMEIGKTITLNNKQAELFVRGRRNVADQTNVSRIKRQNQYIEALYGKIKDVDLSASTIYKKLSDYLVT
ncbi:MAG: LCP family protein, partial [Oscillospiraceae bacterium]|nr:LCP family protein [Oscillospiraceae bacterium]